MDPSDQNLALTFWLHIIDVWQVPSVHVACEHCKRITTKSGLKTAIFREFFVFWLFLAIFWLNRLFFGSIWGDFTHPHSTETNRQWTGLKYYRLPSTSSFLPLLLRRAIVDMTVYIFMTFLPFFLCHPPSSFKQSLQPTFYINLSLSWCLLPFACLLQLDAIHRCYPRYHGALQQYYNIVPHCHC